MACVVATLWGVMRLFQQLISAAVVLNMRGHHVSASQDCCHVFTASQDEDPKGSVFLVLQTIQIMRDSPPFLHLGRFSKDAVFDGNAYEDDNIHGCGLSNIGEESRVV